MPATSKPQLEGAAGHGHAALGQQGTQAPSEPSRAQLPPPRASTTARQVTWHRPQGWQKAQNMG